MPTLRDIMTNGGVSTQEERDAIANALLEYNLRANEGGTASQMVQDSDFIRGAAEGPINEQMAQTFQTPTERGIMDRVAWGADIGEQGGVAGPMALIPPIAYEGVKALAPGILGAIGKVLPQGETMAPEEGVTSPASLANISALISGYMAGRSKK
jgi:hypothetical protein